jgi:outer membrane lipoprotein-sorting protein
VVLTTVTACVHRLPAPVVASTSDLVSRIQRAATPVSRYSADLRTTYFGPEGRVRTNGSIAVARPGSIRCEINGPQGGAVSAFATNGIELQALDLARSRFVYGPATVQNLDRLLPFAPLQLNAQAWVKLLFGEIDVPSDAVLTRDERANAFKVAWHDQGQAGDREVEIDATTMLLTRASVLAQGALVSQVTIDERDGRGLPTRLHVRLPGAGLELEVAWRDIEADGPLDPALFVLDPPPGMAPEHL